MKQTLYLLFSLLSVCACGQAHEVLITDTAHIGYSLEDDSVINFSFKKSKNLKGLWIAYYDESKKRKAIEATFKKGKLTGTEKQWYENGQLKAESIDVDNKSLWSYKKWYPDGKLYSERKCMNDTCTTECYYANGLLMERDIETFDMNGVRNWFYSITYCDNGQIKSSPPLNPDSKDPQLITTYYCSGSRKEAFTLLPVKTELLRIAHYTEWFENGAMKIQGYYDETHPGKRMGTWTYYNSNSKLIKHELYENGELKEKMEY